jgi:hypothetical protein
MLGPIAIDKGGLLTILWERRLAIDPDLIAVCLFAGLGLTAALTLASCGRHLRRLGWTLWRISSRSTFMHRFFFAGDKTSFKCFADCDAPHIRFRPARVKGPAETKSTEIT